MLTLRIIGTAMALAALTPGQKTWLGSFAVRMVKLSEEQQKVLAALKSCKEFESISAIPKPTKVANEPSSTLPVASRERDSAIFCLTSAELTKEMSPLHDLNERATVWSNFRAHSIFFPSVKWLRWYLGDAIGFYFAWLYYYCVTLVIPSAAGLLTWTLVSIAGLFPAQEDEEAEKNGPPPISIFRIYYGLVVIVWAIACTKIWRRQQAQLAEDWLSPALTSSADMAGWINSPTEKLRPSFRGEIRRSPITAELELHFPASKRRMLYLTSGAITFVCVLLALFVNVLLMNLEVC